MTKKFLPFNSKYKGGVLFFVSPRDIEKGIWGEPVGGNPPTKVTGKATNKPSYKETTRKCQIIATPQMMASFYSM